MADSQSRYSIVERLTQTKLDIIGAKSRLDEEIKGKEQAVDKLKQELSYWKNDVKVEVERNERAKSQAIEQATFELKNLKDQVETKAAVFDQKLAAIEAALKSVEDISRSSVAQEQS